MEFVSVVLWTLLGFSNLRVVGKSGDWEDWEGISHWASGKETRTSKRCISRQFSVRPWYHSGRAGPFLPKHDSPTLSPIKNIITPATIEKP
uniref:SFRICE_013683 n=1 Tax=Spodoptera frugiperda TaxID=7108 RepID=A0A2H1WQ79_SPOFR